MTKPSNLTTTRALNPSSRNQSIDACATSQTLEVLFFETIDHMVHGRLLISNPVFCSVVLCHFFDVHFVLGFSNVITYSNPDCVESDDPVEHLGSGCKAVFSSPYELKSSICRFTLVFDSD
ncbi:hypothetical protein EYC84_006737 [Monilinia fructicola]|uniref:Uncharacterized protein n=1 Tax=Monilinia fructicola TaxID=38448 RepID=A0A5M9K837_MONFR|nr:hypothetical protein EYC84_006737 [Monilinia fructicola]